MLISKQFGDRLLLFLNLHLMFGQARRQPAISLHEEEFCTPGSIWTCSWSAMYSIRSLVCIGSNGLKRNFAQREANGSIILLSTS